MCGLAATSYYHCIMSLC